MQNTQTRGEVIAQTKTLLSGLDSKNYHATRQKFAELGFMTISTADIEADKKDAYRQAIERYEEAYSPFCIMIAIHDSGKVKTEIKNVNEFEHYCNSNDITGEEFLVWYCSAEEQARLHEAVRQGAELVGNACI